MLGMTADTLRRSPLSSHWGICPSGFFWSLLQTHTPEPKYIEVLDSPRLDPDQAKYSQALLLCFLRTL